jgi:hypothetical protein
MTNSVSARQSARAVLMVRPKTFGWNPQTSATNRFQRTSATDAPAIVQAAIAEFDALAGALSQAGVEVHVIEDAELPHCPDAVFPNNWVTFHDDGSVVLYPMLAPNRRLERRTHRLHEVVERGGFRVTRLLDLTHHELADRFLEGTGSVVFDHVARVAYACVSPRTSTEVLGELCAELGYRAVSFAASDRGGVPVYHTNVLLAVGTRFALVCDAAIDAGDRGRVLGELAASGRDVITVGHEELQGFAGNVLELEATNGCRVLASSQRAHDVLSDAVRTRLSGHVDAFVAVSIPTIERHGGGSVRCMLAEIQLPRTVDA